MSTPLSQFSVTDLIELVEDSGVNGQVLDPELKGLEVSGLILQEFLDVETVEGVETVDHIVTEDLKVTGVKFNNLFPDLLWGPGLVLFDEVVHVVDVVEGSGQGVLLLFG